MDVNYVTNQSGQRMEQQKEGTLTDTAELDELLAQADQLALLETRVRYTLSRASTIQ